MKEEGICPKCDALSKELGGFRGTVGSISWESFRQTEDRALERGKDQKTILPMPPFHANPC